MSKTYTITLPDTDGSEAQNEEVAKAIINGALSFVWTSATENKVSHPLVATNLMITLGETMKTNGCLLDVLAAIQIVLAGQSADHFKTGPNPGLSSGAKAN
jgi:hypothetical protein